jgi:hypothetical protein
MAGKTKWIKEVAQEINRSQAALTKATKGAEINSKYDVLICYAKWSVPKLKDVEKQELWYKRRIDRLEQLIYDWQNITEKMKVEFDKQMETKDKLIETQNEMIADQDRRIMEQAKLIAEMEEILRGLPVASGE